MKEEALFLFNKQRNILGIYKLSVYQKEMNLVIMNLILKDILNSRFKSKCLALDQMSLLQTFPLIANCDVAICNDSSFSHLSAAIRIPTIVLMADTPLLYGSYSSKMFPIIPEGETTVYHDTLGKDKIDPQKIFIKFKDLIN